MRLIVPEGLVDQVDPRGSGLRAATESLQRRLAPFTNRVDVHLHVVSAVFNEVDLLFKPKADWRVIFRITRIDEQFVAEVRHAMPHGREYTRLYSDHEYTPVFDALTPSELRASLIDRVQADNETAYEIRAAAVSRLDAELRGWLEAPGKLRQHFYGHSGSRRVRERQSFSQYARGLTDEARKELHRSLIAQATNDDVGEGAGEGWRCIRTAESMELAGEAADADDAVSRLYSDELLTASASHRWLRLIGIEHAAEDPSLPFDESEFAVLDGLTSPSHLPALIHGPAGSGKSTVLANFLAYLLDKSVSASSEVRFITYSPRLASDTAARVANHLVVHYGQAVGVATATASRSCSSWHELLSDIISAPEMSSQLVGSREFTRWYNGQTHLARLGLSARAAWWVVRSLLRGPSLLGLALPSHPDELSRRLRRELDQRARAVGQEAQELLEIAATTILPTYEKWLESSEQQDDQAMAARALRELTKNATGIAPAIVCDEVQDFTLLQLQTLAAMLHQRHYDLGPEAGGLPLIFAGDPDQDVNHSGFRWDTFRGMLGEVLISVGRPSTVAEQLNLTANHRCQANIVAVAERVRQRVSEPGPAQQARRPAGSDVLVIDLEQHAQPARQVLAEAEVLVPEQLLADHPLTHHEVQEALAPSDSVRVHSPGLAKGLEFGAAVLYGFAQTVGGASGRDDTGFHDDDLAALYVSTTRARDHLLFIEDTAADATALRTFLGLDPSPDKVGGLVRSILGATDDVDTALQLLEQSLDEHEPSAAMAAARRLQQAGASEDDIRCAELVAQALEAGTVPERLPQGQAGDRVARWALDTGKADWLAAGTGELARLAPLLNGHATSENVVVALDHLEQWGSSDRRRPTLLRGIHRAIVDAADPAFLTPGEWERAEAILDGDAELIDAYAWCVLGVLPEFAVSEARGSRTRWLIALEIAGLRSLEQLCPAERVDLRAWNDLDSHLEGATPATVLSELIIDRVIDAVPERIGDVLDVVGEQAIADHPHTAAALLTMGLELFDQQIEPTMSRARQLHRVLIHD